MHNIASLVLAALLYARALERGGMSLSLAAKLCWLSRFVIWPNPGNIVPRRWNQAVPVFLGPGIVMTSTHIRNQPQPARPCPNLASHSPNRLNLDLPQVTPALGLEVVEALETVYLVGSKTPRSKRSVRLGATVGISPSNIRPQYGFATFLSSLMPVSGSLYSFQVTGNIVLPASLVAMITPYSFLAVDR